MDIEVKGTIKDFIKDFIEDAVKKDNKGIIVIYNTYVNGGRYSIRFKVFILVILLTHIRLYVCALAATLVRLCVRLRLRSQSRTVGLRTDHRVARARLTKQAGETRRDFSRGHTAS